MPRASLGRFSRSATLAAVGLFCLIFPVQTVSPHQIKVRVEEVLVNVLVSDPYGKPVAGLEKDDFRLFEDGEEQQIRSFFPIDAPFSVALVLDTSYSTLGKLPQIQNSAIEFLRQIHPDDEVTVISFDDEVYQETDFTRNKDEAARAVKQTRTGQATQVYEAVYLSLEQLEDRSERRVLVLFTDGVDTASRGTSAKETIKLAEESEVTVYTIYFDTKQERLRQVRGGATLPIPGRTTSPFPGPSPSPYPPGSPGSGPLPVPMPAPMPRPRDIEQAEREIDIEYARASKYLSDLADSTGGRRFDASSDLKSLSSVFAQIAAEMRSLYSLAYVPSDPEPDGRFRKIEVRVTDSGLRTRYRKGYYLKAR